MKRLAFSIIGLIGACGLSAFIALISFGVVAGLSVALAPEASFKLVAPLACPNGTLDYQEYQASYNRPGESQFKVDCVSADGTRNDITWQTLGYVTALSYLACFVPLCIPLGLVGFTAPLFLARLTRAIRSE